MVSTSRLQGYRLALLAVRELLQRPEHRFPRLGREPINIGGSQPLGGNGREDWNTYNVSIQCSTDGTNLKHPKERLEIPLTLHRHDAAVENLLLEAQDIAVVRDNDRDNRDLSLDRKMESALLEGEKFRAIGIRARALGEDVDALLLVLHEVGSTIEGGAGGLAIATIDENRLGKGHCRFGAVNDP